MMATPFSVSNSSTALLKYSNLMKKTRDQPTSCIGEGTIFTGDIETQRSLIVMGKVEGNIRAGSVTISGHVNGNIETADLLELTETAYINGDIYASRLRILNGGIFNGTCSISD